MVLKQQVWSTWEWILFPYAAQDNVLAVEGGLGNHVLFNEVRKNK